MLLLTLVGVAEQDHLTQEGVHDHVLVVDLFAAREGEDRAESRKGRRREDTAGNKHITKVNVTSQTIIL